MPLMGDKEWELAQEMLERFEAASAQNLEAAQINERAAEEFGNQVQNFEAQVRKLRDFS